MLGLVKKIIIGAVLLVIVILGIVFFVKSEPKKNKPEEERQPPPYYEDENEDENPKFLEDNEISQEDWNQIEETKTQILLVLDEWKNKSGSEEIEREIKRVTILLSSVFNTLSSAEQYKQLSILNKYSNQKLNDLAKTWKKLITKKEKFSPKNNTFDFSEEEEPNEEKNWGDIHECFTKYPQLLEEWKKGDYSYEEAQEWMVAGIKPWEIDFLNWLLATRKWEDEEITPVWISTTKVEFGTRQQTSNKEIMWKEYIKTRVNFTQKSNNPDHFKDLINEIVQLQIYAGDETARAVLEFTELNQYEEFCQNKGERWNYYDSWQHYLRKWREIEENSQNN